MINREKKFVEADKAREKFSKAVDQTFLTFGLAAASMGVLFFGSVAYLAVKHSNSTNTNQNQSITTEAASTERVQPDSVKLSLPKP